MAQILKKFVQRAPRYVLRPDDDRLIRFAAEAQRAINSVDYSTLFVNLSSTGLAFVVDDAQAPQLGARIKIEFTIPGDQRIAWFGEVVRIETFDPKKWYLNPKDFEHRSTQLIGIRFLEMPIAHRKAINKALNQKFLRLVKNQRWNSLLAFLRYGIHHFGKPFLVASLFGATFYFLYWISRPSENYDAQRGAPWGQRFQNWHQDFFRSPSSTEK